MCHCWKADEAIALGRAEEQADEVPAEDDADSDASSESHFGVAKVAKKAAPAPARAKKSEEKGGGPSSAVKAEEKTEKGDKLIARAKQVISGLEAVTPLTIWQGTVKEKDCASRASKAYSIAEQLQKDGSAEAKELDNTLRNLADSVERNIELLNGIRPLKDAADSSRTCQVYDPDTVMKIGSLPGDCLNAILADWGRHILQDNRLPRFVQALLLGTASGVMTVKRVVSEISGD